MAFIPQTGSTVAFQGNPSLLQATVGLNSTNASVITVGSPVANQSISGTVGASVIGLTPVSVSNFPANQSISGTIQTDVQGSIAAVIIGGSIVASFTPPANQSVSGTVGASLIGLSPVSVSNFPANQSVSGTVGTTQSGTWISSIVSTVPSSVIVGASIFGQLPAGTAPLGSVATLQGTNPWLTTLSASTNSSVLVRIQANSVAGTYAEDTAHATGANGLFVLGVRNDTLASVTSANGDYSAMAQGPSGETIVSNSPLTRWLQGTADLRGNAGGSVAVIAAQGASVFTYITGVQIANMGSASVLVTLSGATSSIIGYTIAPAGGGSNIMYWNALKTNANGAFTASISGQASVLVSAQGFSALI